MVESEDANTQPKDDARDNGHLILDGTASLDYSDDEQVPRVKGLVELIKQYLGEKSVRGFER